MAHRPAAAGAGASGDRPYGCGVPPRRRVRRGRRRTVPAAPAGRGHRGGARRVDGHAIGGPRCAGSGRDRGRTHRTVAGRHGGGPGTPGRRRHAGGHRSPDRVVGAPSLPGGDLGPAHDGPVQGGAPGRCAGGVSPRPPASRRAARCGTGTATARARVADPRPGRAATGATRAGAGGRWPQGQSPPPSGPSHRPRRGHRGGRRGAGPMPDRDVGGSRGDRQDQARAGGRDEGCRHWPGGPAD